MLPNVAAGFGVVPAVVPEPNSPPLLADDAGVAAAPPNVEPVAFPAPNADPPPNVEPVACAPPNRPLPAADVGLDEGVLPNLNPPAVAAPPLAGALPKSPPDAGAVVPKGEVDAPELFPALEKLKADMANAD